jgi:hypothetical protein
MAGHSPAGISITGALVRVALAVVLVLTTFNPSGYSLYHWLAGEPLGITPGKALAFLVLLIGWFICVRTAAVALGWIGLALGAALLAALVWLLTDRGWISLDGTGVVWLSLAVVGVLLGVGLSWSLLRAKATGQMEVQ